MDRDKEVRLNELASVYAIVEGVGRNGYAHKEAARFLQVDYRDLDRRQELEERDREHVGKRPVISNAAGQVFAGENEVLARRKLRGRQYE